MTFVALVASSASSLPPSPAPWTIVQHWNAVPKGKASTLSSVNACEALCTGTCSQFSFNLNSGHCFTSTSATWGGYALDHVTSGCRGDRVKGCLPQPPPAPSPTPPPFDGVLRPNGKGRLDAYLSPPFVSSHASMVEQTSEGRLHMAWFSGTKEGADNVSIVYAQLNATYATGERGWSAASVVSQREGFSNQNAVLYANMSSLHLFHSQQPASKGEKTATVWHLSAAVNTASATASFSTPHEVFAAPGSFDKNRVQLLLDGTWLLPLYNAADNTPFNALLPPRADADNASSWRVVHNYVNCSRLVQPTVVRPVPGKSALLAFFRDRGARNIYSAASADDGATWSSCRPTTLPNNNAGIEAWTMRSGRIALVYNPQTHGRDPLAISLSEDGGATWKYTRALEHEDGKQEFSYPTVREDVKKDGVIHVSYTYKRQTIKHSIISEGWVMEQPDPPTPPPPPTNMTRVPVSLPYGAAAACGTRPQGAALNGVFYFLPTAGSELNASGRMVTYALKSATWGSIGLPSSVQAMLTGISLTSVGDDFLVASGGGTHSVMVYSVSNGSWSAAPAMSHAQRDSCTVGCRGYWFSMTGDIVKEHELSPRPFQFKPADRQVYRYNLSSGEHFENNGEKQRGGAACGCDATTNRVFWAGGEDNSGISSNVEYWGASPFARRGQPMRSLKDKRRDVGGVGCGGAFVVAGGSDGKNVFDSVDVFIANSSATGGGLTLRMPSPIQVARVECVGDRYVTISGGLTPAATCNADVYVLDTQQLPATGSTLSALAGGALVGVRGALGSATDASSGAVMFFDGTAGEVLLPSD